MRIFETQEDVEDAMNERLQVLELSRKLAIETAEKFKKELREIRDDD